jgi:hypothetical protein
MQVDFVSLAEQFAAKIVVRPGDEARAVRNLLEETVRMSPELRAIHPKNLEPIIELFCAELYAALQATRIARETEYLS